MIFTVKELNPGVISITEENEEEKEKQTEEEIALPATQIFNLKQLDGFHINRWHKDRNTWFIRFHMSSPTKVEYKYEDIPEIEAKVILNLVSKYMGI